MTNGINNGGTAFPSKFTIESGSFDPVQGKVAQGNQVYVQMGMTMRDYFAGKAIQGMLANDQAHKSDEDMLARNAYKMADAMLRAREK